MRIMWASLFMRRKCKEWALPFGDSAIPCVFKEIIRRRKP